MSTAVFLNFEVWMHASKINNLIQARIAQLVAYQLGTGDVPGSNPGKGESLFLGL